MTAPLKTQSRFLPAVLLACAAVANTLSPAAQAANVSVSNVFDVNGLFGTINFFPETNQFVLVPTGVESPFFDGQTNFQALAVGQVTTPFSIAFDTVTATFTAASGFKIDSIDLIEVGKFARSGNSAQTLVGGSLTVNGAAPINFVPSEGANGIGGSPLSDWSIGGVGNPVHVLVNSSVASVVLSDVLGASVNSTSEDVAVIFKTAVVMTINTSAVPVPSAVWMLGSGLLVLGARRKARA